MHKNLAWLKLFVSNISDFSFLVFSAQNVLIPQTHILLPKKIMQLSPCKHIFSGLDILRLYIGILKVNLSKIHIESDKFQNKRYCFHFNINFLCVLVYLFSIQNKSK